MIFSSVNEDGIPKWKLILDDIKVNGHDVSVTRRFRPMEIGKIRAIQPNRGIKQVCKVEILNVFPHIEWCRGILETELYLKFFESEANREGFNTWIGLLNYFKLKKIDINKTYRIQFEKVL